MNASIPASSFKGECKAIEGAIFDCSNPHQSTEYESTIKRVADRVGSTYDEAGDSRRVILEMNIPTFDLPEMKESVTTTDAKIWDFKYKAMMTRVTLLRRNTEKLFSLLLGQCTPSMLA